MSSQITIRQMIEAGVHFSRKLVTGIQKWHNTFGARNKSHHQLVRKSNTLFNEAQDVVRRLVANKGTVLFL